MKVTPTSPGSIHPGRISTHHGGREAGGRRNVVVKRDELVLVLRSWLSRQSSRSAT